MPTYIVTEKLHGDEGEGKLALLESFSSKAGAEWYRKEILRNFNEPKDLEIWKKI